jgi:hypothetical protein
VDFIFAPDGQLVVKPRTLHVEQLFGCLRRKGERAVSLAEMDAAIAEGAAKGER